MSGGSIFGHAVLSAWTWRAVWISDAALSVERCPQNCQTATLRVNILCPVRRINVPLLTGDPLPGFPHRAAIVLSIFLVAIWETDIRMVTVILMAAGSL